MTGMNMQPSNQPKPSTYAEDARPCEVCGKEFKVHRYNRHRRTCSKECSLALRSAVQKKAIAEGRAKMPSKTRARNDQLDFSARFDDPRDHQALLHSLFLLTWSPCQRCGGVEFYSINASGNAMYACANRNCRMQRTVRRGTILYKSQAPLPVWMEVIRCVWQDNEIRTAVVVDRVGISKKQAWYMLRRVRTLHPEHPLVKLALHPELPVVKGSLATGQE